MLLGEKLLALRKKAGLSQEEAAERLGVSRQTVSKWETGQTVPELLRAKQLSQLYCVSYESLVSEGCPAGELTDMDALSDEIDWTAAWARKYPILTNYAGMEGIARYRRRMAELYDDFRVEYGCDDTDTVLILKDILYHKYRAARKPE